MSENVKIGNRIRQFRLSREEDQNQFARIINVSQQQLSKYENSYVEPSSKFYVKLCEVFPELNLRWLITGEGNMLTSGVIQSDGMSFIPYWDGCPHCAEKTRKSSIKDGIYISEDVIVKEWGCNPKDIRVVSTPGEEMDGGKYPIRNDDILVIDTSKTNISDSGIYLITTNNCETVALRRLMEMIDGTVTFYVENDKYAFAINKSYTREELDAMDFKVIGRVVKNVTYTL